MGVNGCVIISHGSSDAKAICSAIGVANDYVKGNVLKEIRRMLAIDEGLLREETAANSGEGGHIDV